MSVVEFQPGGFSKGSYLNVEAHWLWGAIAGHLSFDYDIGRIKPKRCKPWIAFHDVDQFRILAERLARQAAEESDELQATIRDIPTLATMLVAEEVHHENEGRGGGWPAFHAAVASGLSGDIETAQKLFNSAYDTIVPWRRDLQDLLVPYAKALKNYQTFVNFIAYAIDKQRSMYGLAPLSSA